MLKNPLLQKRLLAYSAAAGVALAGGVALADTNDINEVKPISNVNFTITPGSPAYEFDFDGDSNKEGSMKIVGSTLKIYQISGTDRLSLLYRQDGNQIPYDEGNDIPGGGQLFQSLVANSSGYNGSIRKNQMGDGTNGNYVIGLKLKLNGSDYFGWIRLDFTGDFASATIKDYAYEDSGGSIQSPGDNPLAVTLANFAALADGTDVSVTWSTVSESDNLGFNLYRSSDPAELGTKLNTELIPAQAPGSGQGSTYDYLDENLAAGSYFYTLEDVDVNGTPTRHAPVSVTIGQVTAVALNQLESSDESSPLGLLVAGGALAAVAVAARRRRSSND